MARQVSAGPGPAGPHRPVNPPELAPPVGFSHAVSAAPGRAVYLGGQAGLDGAGFVDPTSDLVEQFDLALANLVTTLHAAGAAPEHLVCLTVFATDGDRYRASLRELGAVYRQHLGRHYPAMAFLEVKGLFDPAALVEITGVAVVPDAADGGAGAAGRAADADSADSADTAGAAGDTAGGAAADSPERPG